MKHKRILGYGAIGLTLIAIGVAFIKPVSASSILFRVRATDAVAYSQTISRNTGGLVTRSNIYNYVSTTTSSGTTFYCRNVNDSSYSLGSSYVAVLPGSTDNPSKTPEITFTRGNATASSETPFEFQNITSISVTSDTTSRTLDVFKSDDGDEWVSAGTMASSGGTNTNVDGAKYVKITYSGFYAAYINTITINYSCSYVPPEPKVLDSISVSGATTEFSVGDSFVFDGTVTASYTNSSLYPDANVTSYAVVVEEPDMNEAADDVVVVISYTEKGITKTDSYTINIKESGATGLNGTFTMPESSYYVFVFESATTGYYQRTFGGSVRKAHFTYTIENSKLTLVLTQFTYTGSANGNISDFANPYKPFCYSTPGTTNATGSITSSSEFSITLFKTATSGGEPQEGSVPHTFTKS